MMYVFAACLPQWLITRLLVIVQVESQSTVHTLDEGWFCHGNNKIRPDIAASDRYFVQIQSVHRDICREDAFESRVVVVIRECRDRVNLHLSSTKRQATL